MAYQHILELTTFGCRSDFNTSKGVFISYESCTTLFFLARAQENNSLRTSLKYTYTESSMTKHDDGFTPSLFAASKNLEECRIPDQ